MKTQSSEVDRNIEQALRNTERRARYDLRKVSYVRRKLARIRLRQIKAAVLSAVLLGFSMPLAERWTVAEYQSEPKPFPAREYVWRDNRGFG